MNKMFWSIGKEIYNLKNNCFNPCEYISNYYSYKYGDSFKYSRENISIMRNFYLCFPIYIKNYDNISWNHFKLLININDKIIRNFYLRLIIFCNSSVDDLNIIINSSLYNRI